MALKTRCVDNFLTCFKNVRLEFMQVQEAREGPDDIDTSLMREIEKRRRSSFPRDRAVAPAIVPPGKGSQSFSAGHTRGGRFRCR